MNKIAETRKYFVEEIKQKELINKKHKKVCKTLNYIEHLLILAYTVIGCILISVFTSLIGIPVGVASSVVERKIYALTAVIKKFKSIIKKRKEKTR